MDDMPLDTVENQQCCDMIIVHDPDAKKIYHWMVHEKICYFKANIHAAIRKLLSVDGQWVDLTTDHWTLIAKQSYCGMSTHWIGGNCNIHNKALGCWLHESNSLGDTLRDEFLLNLFTKYSFDKLNIIAVVSDTTGNMNKFGMKLQVLSILHIYCTDHVIQLTVKKAYLDKFYNIVPGGNVGMGDDDGNFAADISTMAKA
jgi:hypothetical protein